MRNPTAEKSVAAFYFGQLLEDSLSLDTYGVVDKEKRLTEKENAI